MMNNDDGDLHSLIHTEESNICNIDHASSAYDEGYGSQESTEPPSPENGPEPDFHHSMESSTEDQIPSIDDFSSGLTFEDENVDSIETVTKGIAFVLVKGNPVNKITKSEEIREIVETVKELTEMMRTEMKTHFTEFEKNLRSGLEKTNMGQQGNRGKRSYLVKAHKQLVQKVVGDTPSWRGFANVINCTHLVLEVAKTVGLVKDNRNYKEMLEEVEDQLIKVSKEKFESFIQEMGGFIDIVDYFTHVQKQQIQPETESRFSPYVLGAGALLAFGALFSRS